MSEWEFDGVGMSLLVADHVHVMVYDLDTPQRWACQVTALNRGDDCVHLVESDDEHATMQVAQVAGLEAALALAKRIEETAGAELRRIKRAAQDADDAALVATIGGEVWTARDAGWAVLHTAQVAGHRCLVSVSPDGSVKWEIEPEHYGHPYTWDAPDLETAKIRAAAAALREPCKRWRVTLPPQRRIGRRIEGGEVEVWAVTREGALYRAAQALGAGFIGGGSIEGEAVEVAG